MICFMKKLLIMAAFFAFSFFSIVDAAKLTQVVEIGQGDFIQEKSPILNWWLSSYQGNETLFLKEELNMQPGDKITALSYHCIRNSAYGGNFNVRINNTTLSQVYEGDEDWMDPSVIKVPYESPVYGHVHIEPYSADCWITFELTTPFEYTGDNIIIDIRNSEPSQRAGWCYFASSPCDYFKTLVWRNASDEAVTGFVDGYSPFGEYDTGLYISESPDEDYFANIRITYIRDIHKPKVTHVGDGNLATEQSPIVNWWLSSYQGSEVIYLKDDLGLEKGDTLSAISYHCIRNSARGGNFNVRIKNTDAVSFYENEIPDQGTVGDQNLSVMQMGYNDTVYANVQLGSYSAGDWIVFKLSKPFIYEGENIVIDIRNTETSSTSGWCYFESTQCDEVRSICWWRANGEDVTEFESTTYNAGIYVTQNNSYSYFCYPNIRIFVNGMLCDVNDDSKINIADVTELIDYLLSNEAESINLRNADVDGDGNITIVDVTDLIDILLSGNWN